MNKLKRLLLLSMSMLTVAAALTPLANQRASAQFAQTETYTWTSYDTLEVTGGQMRETSKLSVEGNSIFGLLKHSGAGSPHTDGCDIPISGTVQTVNTVIFESFVGPITPEKPFCPSSISSQYLNRTIETSIRPPENPNNSGGGSGEEGDDNWCANLPSVIQGGIGWFLCDIGEITLNAVGRMDALILQQLALGTDSFWPDALDSPTEGNPIDGDPVRIFDTENQESARAFYRTWSIFRNLAYTLLVIIGLVMVISQMLSLELFSAYTVRKMLPRLIIAAVAIPLMWPILELLITMANDSAWALWQLINSQFADIGNDVSLQALFMGTGAALAGSAGVIALFSIGGWGAFLPIIAAVFLAIFSALLILITRDVVAYLLIVISPIAIVSAAFEPFRKLFSLWRTFLVTVLLSIPAIATILATTKAAARISIAAHDNASNEWLGVLLAIVFLIVGYILFWKVFQMLDKVAGQLGNLVSRVTGKAQEELLERSGDTTKRRLGEAVEGRRKLSAGGSWVAGLVRRGKLMDQAGIGAFGIGKKGRAKYAEAVRTMQAGIVSKAMEQDRDRASGDDDAMRLLMQPDMTDGKFLSEYAAIQKRRGETDIVAAEKARSALGLTQSSFGVRAGTDSMRVIAAKSLLKSNTSYRYDADGNEMNFEEMTRAVYGDVGQLVRDGLITVGDGAAMIKSNSARPDRAGVGFGTVISKLDKVARAKNGAEALGKDEIDTMAEQALEGSGPGQLIGQRHESLRILGPEMAKQAQRAYEEDGNTPGQKFIKQIAAAASRRDLAGQLPALNAGLLASLVESREVGGKTIQQWEEYFRTPTDYGGAPPELQAMFQQYRREYSSAWQQRQQTAPTDGPPDPTRGPAG